MNSPIVLLLLLLLLMASAAFDLVLFLTMPAEALRIATGLQHCSSSNGCPVQAEASERESPLSIQPTCNKQMYKVADTRPCLSAALLCRVAAAATDSYVHAARNFALHKPQTTTVAVNFLLLAKVAETTTATHFTRATSYALPCPALLCSTCREWQ